MVLKNADRKLVLETLNDIRPYIVEIQLVEQVISGYMESSSSIEQFAKKLEERHDELDDSVARTDLRIYIGRLRRKMKHYSILH
jgi:hypothetical protein